MAIFDNSIDRDPLSVTLPSDWSLQFGVYTGEVISDTTTGITNQILNTSSVTTNGEASWNFPSVIGDGEVLSLAKLTGALGAGASYTFAACRLSTAAESFTGCWVVSSSTNAGTVIRLINFVGGVASAPLSSATFNWTINTWYWCRLNFQSSIIKGKIWALGTSEPSAFQLNATTTSVTSGLVGARFTNSGGATLNFGWFSAASGSDVAPSPGYAGAVGALSMDPMNTYAPLQIASY